eukprot:m.59937 g.59937  ORF g.59937 m.59937 type:complete len:524 (+) comp13830_c0_seq1:147-1718(+)
MASDERMKEFKFKGRTADTFRERRTEEGVQLRKAKREERAMKKRNIDLEQPEQPVVSLETETAELLQLCTQLQVQDYSVISQSIVRLREMFARAVDPPIAAACEHGCVPVIVQLLQYHDFPDVQFEAAWCLTNITSSESAHVQAVIDAGALIPLVALLSSRHLDAKDQAAWALGNIAGDCEAFRDQVLAAGALMPLIKIISKESRDDIIRNANWTLSNLCRGKKPKVDFESIAPALTVMHRMLYSEDEQLLIDTCWALAFISQGPPQQVERIIQAGVVGQLVRLIMHTKFAIVTPALRALGNLSCGNDRQTQILLNNQLLPAIKSLLTCHKEPIRKEACWIVSNVLAGTHAQIKEVMRANIIPDLVARVHDGAFKTRREAAWALCNMCVSGTGDQVEWLAGQQVVPALAELLAMDDNKLIGVLLDGLSRLLEVGYQGPSQPNAYHDLFEECGAIDKIEAVLSHPDPKLYEIANHVVERYFQWSDDVEAEMPEPAQDASGQLFQFGTPAAGAHIPGSPFPGYSI